MARMDQQRLPPEGDGNLQPADLQPAQAAAFAIRLKIACAGVRAARPRSCRRLMPARWSMSCRSTRSNWRCRTRNSSAPGQRPKALEKYHDLFDFAPVGYFLWDAKGHILEVNLVGAILLGLNRETLIQSASGNSWCRKTARPLPISAARAFDRDPADLPTQALRRRAARVRAGRGQGRRPGLSRGRRESAARRSSTSPSRLAPTSWRPPTRPSRRPGPPPRPPTWPRASSWPT